MKPTTLFCRSFSLAVCTSLIPASIAVAQIASLDAIGYLPGHGRSEAQGVSADGSVVVRNSALQAGGVSDTPILPHAPSFGARGRERSRWTAWFPATVGVMPQESPQMAASLSEVLRTNPTLSFQLFGLIDRLSAYRCHRKTSVKAEPSLFQAMAIRFWVLQAQIRRITSLFAGRMESLHWTLATKFCVGLLSARPFL